MNNYRTVYEISDDIADTLPNIIFPDYYSKDYIFRLKDAKTYDTIGTYSNFTEFMGSDEYRKYGNSPVTNSYDPTDNFEGFYGMVWVVDTETTIDITANLEERNIAISFKFNDTEESPVLKLFKGFIYSMLADFKNTLEDELNLIESLSEYYLECNKSFEGLEIDPECQELFDYLAGKVKENCVNA